MIKKLPPHIVHQIAAGEVVERSASALKELIENSLDAQASKISVEYEEGGLRLLCVEDDGVGLDESEIPLAFEAHATSKIQSFDDLESLKSMGFRGEALSSISSVSELEIWSSTREQSHGAIGRVSFGVSGEVSAGDKRVGTRVTVRDLFSRHPARLKFIKGARSETRHLMNVWKRYVLCFNNVAWSISDRKTKKALNRPIERRLDRVLWFFDHQEPTHWHHAEQDFDSWKVEAIFLKPRYFEKARSGVQLFLNNRPIKDGKLEFALRRAFEGYTEFPRNISAAVFLEGPTDEFDVNVHPTKSEIRFLQPERLFSNIVNTIRPVLEKAHFEEVDLKDFKSSPESESVEDIEGSFQKPLAGLVDRSARRMKALRACPEKFQQREERTREFFNDSVETSSIEGVTVESNPLMDREKFFSQNVHFQYLASIDNTYLITIKAEELFLFDQHALHERILYERLLKDFKEGVKIPSQRLLFPVPVLFEGAEELADKEELLEKIGFELRVWNEGKVQVVAAPEILKRNYQDVLEKLGSCGELPIETLARDILATVACHSAVRAHDKLEREEIERLLSDFQSRDAVGHCPHGRPTFVRFEIKQLEKMFHRII